MNDQISCIKESLDLFFYPIHMGNYSCKSCKIVSDCIQQFYIKDPSKFLIINLKRYKVGPNSDKISDLIYNDFIIDIGKYCMYKSTDPQIENCKYSLYGVVEHQGSLKSGHYIAYVKYKTEKGKEWFKVSDNRVSICDKKTVYKSVASLLFYKMKKSLSIP